MNDLRPFRFWCQKVLPLVYDDSLSYYELLCKVVDYLNKTMENVNSLNENFDELQQMFNTLKQYVDDYFKNLDVQKEINNKLDEMVRTGVFDDIFNRSIFIYHVKNYNELKSAIAHTTNKIIMIDNDITLENDIRINSNTIIDLQKHTLTGEHHIFNFNDNDKFINYNGNCNIIIKNGIISQPHIAFCHGNNITFKDIEITSFTKHIFEIASCSNILWDNVTLNGNNKTYDTYENELLQIDYMGYEEFPYINQNSIMYDKTPNKNITIKNCIFNNCDRGAGSHTYDEQHIHTNILFQNNIFTDFKDCGIIIADSENIKISNNMFKSIDTLPYNKGKVAIKLSSYIKECYINECTFNNTQCGIYSVYPVRNYNTIYCNKNTFINFTYGENTTYANALSNIPINRCGVTNINSFTNNIFTNTNRICVGLQDNVGSKRDDINISICDNNFIIKNTNQNIINVFTDCTINNNIFNVNEITARCISLGDTNCTVKNNTFKNKAIVSNFNVSDNTNFSSNYDIKLRIAHNKNSGTFNYNVNEFNTLLLTFGNSNLTFTTKIRSLTYPNKIDNRKYGIIGIDENNEIVKMILTITDNSYTITGNSTLPLIDCFGINE